MKTWSLRRRVSVGLVAYLTLLTAGVLANDYLVNESAENLVWESLLEAELEHFLARRHQDPRYLLPTTETLELFELGPGSNSVGPLATLSPGIHDEIMIAGRERVVLVRADDGVRYVLALDISDLEARESQVRRTVFICAFVSVLLLGLMAIWGARKLTAPLSSLADQIRRLGPGQGPRKLELPAGAGAEIAVIVGAMNDYNRRASDYIEREKSFLSTMSHELRTPLTVISGAMKLLAADSGLQPAARTRIDRVQNTLADLEEMIVLLLALSKNPERLAQSSQPIRLDALVRELVESHQPLAQSRGLAIQVGVLPEVSILAPPPMASAALGNLLRNAIEHSFRGAVAISLDREATVRIENSARVENLEELARIYTELARGAGRHGGGVGLPLITRLCQHFGWQLELLQDAGVVQFSIRFPPPRPAAATDRAAVA